MSAALCYRVYQGNGQRGSTYNDLAETDPQRFVRYASLSGTNPNDSFGATHGFIPKSGPLNGIWSGTPAYTGAPNTLPGMAFSTNDSRVINIPNPSGIVDHSTITCWIRPTGNQELGGGIFGYRDNISATINNAGFRNLGYNFNNHPSQTSDAFNFGNQPNTPLETGVWQFTTITFDPDTNKIEGSLNLSRSHVKNNAVLGPTFINASGAVGDIPGVASKKFRGDIYDARIYTRVLSHNDFLEIYSGPEPKKAGSPVTPVMSVSGGSFTCTSGAWDALGNGSLQYSYMLQKKVGGSWVDYKHALSPTFQKETGEFRYTVLAINTGGASTESYQSNSFISNQINWISQNTALVANVVAGFVVGTTSETDLVPILDPALPDSQYLSLSGQNVVLTHAVPKAGYMFRDINGTYFMLRISDKQSAYINRVDPFNQPDFGPIVSTSFGSFQNVDLDYTYTIEENKLANKFKRTN